MPRKSEAICGILRTTDPVLGWVIEYQDGSRNWMEGASQVVAFGVARNSANVVYCRPFTVRDNSYVIGV